MFGKKKFDATKNQASSVIDDNETVNTDPLDNPDDLGASRRTSVVSNEVYGTFDPNQPLAKPDNHDREQPLITPEFMQGRKCTDLIWLGVIICLWLGMTGVGIDGMIRGNPDKLINGIDYKGRICGVSDTVEDKAEIYYVRHDGTGICVNGCPDYDATDEIYICVDDDDMPSFLKNASDAAKVNNGWGYCMWTYTTSELLNKCLYTDPDIRDMYNLGLSEAFVEDFLTDCYNARHYIFGFGLGASALISLGYLFTLRNKQYVEHVVKASIGMSFLSLFMIGILAWVQAEQWATEVPKDHTSIQWNTLRMMGLVCLLGSFYFCYYIWKIRSKLHMASGIVYEAVVAIFDFPLILLFPLTQILGWFTFTFIMFLYLLHTASLGSVALTYSSGNTFVQSDWEYSDSARQRFWFFVFSFVWTSEFIVAAGSMIIATAGAIWFFTRYKTQITNKVVLTAVQTVLRFHLGTAALGGLVVLPMQPLQPFLTYMDRTILNHEKVALGLGACFHHYSFYVEHYIRYISKNAYIETAIYGSDFLDSGRKAFFLALRNATRVAAVRVIADFVMLMAKLFISMTSAFFMFIFLEHIIGNNLNSVYPTVCVTMVLAYFVCSMLTETLGMMTSTLLQCFLADEEMFSAQDRYVEKELLEYINTHESEHVKEDHRLYTPHRKPSLAHTGKRPSVVYGEGGEMERGSSRRTSFMRQMTGFVGSSRPPGGSGAAAPAPAREEDDV